MVVRTPSQHRPNIGTKSQTSHGSHGHPCTCMGNIGHGPDTDTPAVVDSPLGDPSRRRHSLGQR